MYTNLINKNHRWISDRNRNANKLAYNIQLSYFYTIKIPKLYVISKLICVSISIGNPPTVCKSCKFFFRFDIKDAPRFGRLERLRGHGKWASTKRFFSRQLEKGKVRYVHTKGNPSSDSFSFTVTVPVNSGSTSSIPGGIMAYTEDTFKIDIISNIIRVNVLKKNFINSFSFLKIKVFVLLIIEFLLLQNNSF